jgi:predicted nuclease of predicted toxin-antitoxin system
MKLLLDENLSRRLVPFLQHDFPGSSQVVLLGMESASDKEVWQRAKSDGFVIVTRDADFQELSLVWGAPPQVIRLRTPNQSRSGVLKLLLDNKSTIESALDYEDKASIELIAQLD